MQKPKTRLGYQRSSVVSHTCDRFRNPGRIPGEKIVIFWCAKKSNDTQLDDEVIDYLLRLRLGQVTRGQVALEVNIKKGRSPSQRHGSAVLFLHSRQIPEIEPLHRLLGVASRT